MTITRVAYIIAYFKQPSFLTAFKISVHERRIPVEVASDRLASHGRLAICNCDANLKMVKFLIFPVQLTLLVLIGMKVLNYRNRLFF